MKKVIFVIFSIFSFSLSLVAQQEKLYQLEKQLIQGKKEALFEIAEYFSNRKRVTEYLGHHITKPRLSTIAKRIAGENCIFSESEINFNTRVSKRQFREFLKKNITQIHYSELADAFIVTPFENREVKYEVVQISDTRKTELLANKDQLMQLPWVQSNGMKKLILEQDPSVLLQIASLLLKERNRHNRYQWNEQEYIDLLELLTYTKIVVLNDKQEMSYQIADDFEPNSKINLLIFFAKYYQSYQWEEQKGIFINKNFRLLPTTKGESLFEHLDSQDDSLALNAFIELSQLSFPEVSHLLDQHSSFDDVLDKNRAIPYIRFLPSLAKLTDYCERNSIDYNGEDYIRNSVKQLKTNLEFKDRYALENQLIETLTLDQITAFEYWCLIYSSTFASSYGRILDKFYSKNWNLLVQDKKNLLSYLKKSRLFDDLGVPGTSNNYLIKFTASPPQIISELKNVHSNDKELKEQTKKALKLCRNKIETPRKKMQEDTKYGVSDLQIKLTNIALSDIDSVQKDMTLAKLLAGIDYSQIGLAIKLVEPYKYKYSFLKYSFLTDDWGFFLLKSGHNKEERERFLKIYNNYDENGLYAFYLNQAGIEYKDVNENLDFDKIYDILKYNFSSKFVYAIIRLLEFHFNTTLGYPQKACSSRGVYGCSHYIYSRTISWRNYLKNNGYLSPKTQFEPVSFNYGLE